DRTRRVDLEACGGLPTVLLCNRDRRLSRYRRTPAPSSIGCWVLDSLSSIFSRKQREDERSRSHRRELRGTLLSLLVKWTVGRRNVRLERGSRSLFGFVQMQRR